MFGKESKERKLFADFYKLCEKHWNLEHGYDAMFEDIDEFRSEYETGDNFASYLCIALQDRIKKEFK
jgi:hypothetical protein